MFFINHPRSKKPDTMLTLAVYATLAVIVKFLLNGVDIFNFNFGTVDAALIGAILTPTLGAYVFRKHSDNVHSTEKTTESKRE